MKKLSVILGLVILYSCADYRGTIAPETQNGQNNKEHIDIAVGYSRVSYFCGMGGLGKEALINDAKRSLYSIKLNPGQFFDNLTLDVKTTYFLLWKKREVVVVADIIQGDSTNGLNLSKKYVSFLPGKTLNTESEFSQNETVLFLDKGQIVEAKIVSTTEDRSRIFFINKNGSSQITSKSNNRIFKTDNSRIVQKNYDFAIGESVHYKYRRSSGELTNESGKVAGLNQNYTLVRVVENFYISLRNTEINKITRP